MPIIAQAEAAIAAKVVEALANQKPANDAQFALYVFVVALLIIGCGGFYVLRYMLTHTREIHETSHRTITGLSESFSAECAAQRDQHHRDMVMSRDNVHDIRDVATVAVSAREFADGLRQKQESRRPPASGTA